MQLPKQCFGLRTIGAKIQKKFQKFNPTKKMPKELKKKLS